jgi:hypothetical protein
MPANSLRSTAAGAIISRRGRDTDVCQRLHNGGY